MSTRQKIGLVIKKLMSSIINKPEELVASFFLNAQWFQKGFQNR